MQTSAPVRVRSGPAAGFTLVEILLALLILSVGLMGVLALFPLGIDATRISVESTRAATIARMAKAALTTATPGPGASDDKTPFQRILETAWNAPNPANRIWHGPYYYGVFYPDLNTVAQRPHVWPASVAPGADPRDPGDNTMMVESDYSWSMVVLYPYGLGPTTTHFGWDTVKEAANMYVVQVTVYRSYRTEAGSADVERDHIILDDVSGADQVQDGDYVRYLDLNNLESTDGVWYRVEEIGVVGGRTTIKLDQRYWGFLDTPDQDTNVAVQFSDKVIGTYTFLMSAY